MQVVLLQVILPSLTLIAQICDAYIDKGGRMDFYVDPRPVHVRDMLASPDLPINAIDYLSETGSGLMLHEVSSHSWVASASLTMLAADDPSHPIQ